MAITILKRMIQVEKEKFNKHVETRFKNKLELIFSKQDFYDNFRQFDKFSDKGEYCFSEFICDLSYSTSRDVKFIE